VIALTTNRSDLPFAEDPSGRFLPGVAAFMVFLAVLTGAAALVASTLAAGWSDGASGRLTVHLVAQPGGRASPFDLRARRALAAVQGVAGVVAARRAGRAEIASLVAPWVGDAAAQDLPLPELIDVSVDPAVADAAARLQAALAPIGGGVEVEDHGEWLGDLAALARSVEIAAFIVLALVASAAALVVAFAVRSGFAIHRDSIEVLHLIGAQDDYVSIQFEQRSMLLALKGGAIGFAAGALVVGLIAVVAGQAEPGLLPALDRAWLWSPILILAPLIAAAIAKYTARVIVHADLAKMV